MKYVHLTLIFLLFFACSQNNSPVLKEFNCKNTKEFLNLEQINDVRNLFTVTLPKDWKTNLYYDNSQTSIYSADTTKNLTNSILIDQTLIHQELRFDTLFFKRIKEASIKTQLKDSILKEITFLNKPSFLQYSIGKKEKYKYQVLQIYSQVNTTNFFHSKIEVYGDSLVNDRVCNALKLIAKAQVK